MKPKVLKLSAFKQQNIIHLSVDCEKKPTSEDIYFNKLINFLKRIRSYI